MDDSSFRTQLVVKAISFGNLIASTVFVSSLSFKGTASNTINYRLIFSILSECFYSISFIFSTLAGPEDQCTYGLRDFLRVFAFFSFTTWTFFLSYSIYQTLHHEDYHADLVITKHIATAVAFCLFLSIIPFFSWRECEISPADGSIKVPPSYTQGFLQILKYALSAAVFVLNVVTIMKSFSRPEPGFAIFENRFECPKLVRRFVPFLILYNTCISPTFLNALDYYFSNNTVENLSLWEDLLTQLIGILYVVIYFLKASVDARIPEVRIRNPRGSLLATPGSNLDQISNYELSRRATPTTFGVLRQASFARDTHHGRESQYPRHSRHSPRVHPQPIIRDANRFSLSSPSLFEKVEEEQKSNGPEDQKNNEQREPQFIELNVTNNSNHKLSILG